MDPETEGESVYFVDTSDQPEDAPSVSIEETIDDASSAESVSTSEAPESPGKPAAPENLPQTENCEGEDDESTHCELTLPEAGIVETILEEVDENGPCKKVVLLTTVEEELAAKTQEIGKETGQDLEQDPGSSQDSTRLSCQFCKKKFTKFSNKLRHVRRSHNVNVNSGTIIRCMECNISFCQLNGLRSHLATKHNLEMVEHELKFPNMDAFYKWKREIERKTLSSYTLRHGARKGPSGPRLFFSCHRSGKYCPKTKSPFGERKRILKTQGSCKMGILCTASIAVHTTPNEVHVRFCPNHYGHGKETTLIQLSAQQQTAIKESVSQGMSYEKLLDEIRDAQSSKDHFQLYLLKRKDIKCINNAFSCDDFYSSMSDADSVDHWVSVCCQMENSPVLFYRKEELLNDKKQQEEFILIIMTEYQKHILQSCDKKVICVDSLYRKKGGRFYLTVMFIMDETSLAFPVAYCISNKVDQNVMGTFYSSLKEASGKLVCQFFMSDCESFYYDMWKIVMDDDPRWLWSMWYVDARFRVQLRVFRGKMQKRAEAYRTMRMLLECQNLTVFQCMLKNFAESLKSDPEAKELGKLVEEHYAPNAEIWAYCYRKEIDLATNIHLEIMHQTFRYCCREGRKTRLDKFIFVIMKYVRDKMFERLCSLLDDDKIEIALTTINECHKLGVEIPKESITTLSDKTWLIQVEEEEENIYVTREYEKCPELCNLKCGECSICIHMYICSCIHNLINANLCPHIHAVVWHLLTPHFTPPPSPVPLLDETRVEEPEVEAMFFSSLVKRCHDVYKQIKANKTNLNTSALNSLMKRLNECIDICAGKLVDEDKDKSKKRKTEDPPANVQPPIYIISSLPMTSDGKSNPVPLSAPLAPINGNQSFILPKTASVPGQNQPILIPSTVSTTRPMLATNRNRPVVLSPTVSTTRRYQPIARPLTKSSTGSLRPVVPSPTLSSASNYCSILLPTTAANNAIVLPSALKSNNMPAKVQGANGIYYLISGSAPVPIETGKT